MHPADERTRRSQRVKALLMDVGRRVGCLLL
jgi:hypothetical protein